MIFRPKFRGLQTKKSNPATQGHKKKREKATAVILAASLSGGGWWSIDKE